jgi:8-oxo-dGTP pyrophosphatase MutT (NUDIX family)
MISSRCNDNFDEFPAPEIEKGYKTFIGKPVFVNHHNDDHRRMRGVIIDAALHRDTLPSGAPDTWVEGLMEVDAVRFPRLAKAIIKGDIDRTSMGCDVDYSRCSVCDNKATNPAEYCKHIPRMKGQRIYRADPKTGRKEGILVREICYGLRFFENSLLVEEPADPTAFFTGVDTSGLAITASKTAMRDQATCPHDGSWNRHGQCMQCGWSAATEDDEPCDNEWCQDHEAPHSKGEHMDPPHLDPGHPDYQSAERNVEDAFKGSNEAWLLRHKTIGPTKWSSLSVMAGLFDFDPAPHRPASYYEMPERQQNGIDHTLETMHQARLMGHKPMGVAGKGVINIHCEHCPNTTTVYYQGGSSKHPGEWLSRGALHASPCEGNPKSLGYQENAGPYPQGEKWTDAEHRTFGPEDETMHSLSSMASHFASSLRTMAESFEIPLSDDDRNFYQQMRDAGEMRAQMHEHGQKREVNLADPTDLKSHLCEAHDIYPADFWRNSYDEDHPALDIAHGDDRPLRHGELKRLHAHDHKHSPGDYPGIIVGESHFHSASKTAELSDEEIRHGLDLPANKGEELGKSLWKGMMDIFDPGGTDESRASERRTQTMSDLLDKGHKPEHIKFDEDDEPYAKVTHPSGWHAKDRGGVYIGIGHEATGDDEDHDVFNVSNPDGYGAQKIDRPTLQKKLNHWVGEHGDEYAQNMSDPRIRRWQRTHHASLDQRVISPTPIDVIQHKPNDQVTYHCPTCGGYDYRTVPHEQFGQGIIDSLIAQHQCRGSRTAAGGSNDRMVKCTEGHEHWGAGGAAGLLLRHRGHDGETRYLLQKRGPKVDHPNTHSIPGGALAPGETPVHGAIREGLEEMHALPNFRVRDTHISDCGGWKYYTVIADVDNQFDPPGDDDEHGGADWHTAREISGLKLHPGFASSWDDIQERGH